VLVPEWQWRACEFLQVANQREDTKFMDSCSYYKCAIQEILYTSMRPLNEILQKLTVYVIQLGKAALPELPLYLES
jgi:hypothetical protein